MLEDIREKKTNRLYYLLVAAAGIGMLFIGVPLFNQQGAEPVVASVNGSDITLQQYNQTYREIQNTSPDMPAAQIKEQALRQIIERTLFEQHALDNGYTLSNLALYEIIKKQFGDNKTYQNWLNNQGISANTYQNSVRREQTIRNYYQILQPPLNESNPLFSNYLQAIAQKRSYTLYTLALAPVAAGVQVSEQEAENYYQEHQDRYMTREKADISYIIFDAAELPVPENLDKAEIAKAKAAAQRRAGAYLIFDDENAANEAEAALQAGKKTFADYRQAIREKKIAGDSGNLDLNTKGNGVAPELDNALFALKEVGDISPVIHSEFGDIIIELTKIDNGNKSDEQWLKEAAAKANESIYTQLANQAYDAAQNNQTLSTIAGITGNKIQVLNNVTADNTSLPWLSNPEVSAQLFGDKATEAGHTALPVELSAQKSLFFAVNKREKPQLIPFASVRAQVIQAYQETQAGAALKEQGEALAKALQDSPEKVAALAEKDHAKIENFTDVSRFAVQNPVIAKLFNHAELVTTVQADNGDVIVAKLNAVKAGDTAVIPAQQRHILFSAWQMQNTNAIYNGMAQWLYNHAKIKIHNDVLEKL